MGCDMRKVVRECAGSVLGRLGVLQEAAQLGVHAGHAALPALFVLEQSTLELQLYRSQF